MKKRCITMLIVLLLLYLVIGCKNNVTTDNSGDYNIYSYTFTVNGNTHLFYIAIPAEEQTPPVPAILGLHWGTDAPTTSALEYLESLMLPGLKATNAVMIAPACPVSATGQVLGWTHDYSKTMLNALLDSVRTWYQIDESRTAVTGYSMGGYGCWHLIHEWPGVFSAGIPMASDVDSTLNPAAWCPIYAIQGELDEYTPGDTLKLRTEHLNSKGAAINLNVVSEATHYGPQQYYVALGVAAQWLIREWGLD